MTLKNRRLLDLANPGLAQLVLGCLLALTLSLSGCENAYESRKTKLWLEDVRTMEKKLESAEGMSIVVLHQQILDRCKQLLDAQLLNGSERVELIKRYVNSSLVLSEKGDRAAAENLTQFCRTLMNDSDADVRETCELAMVEIEAQSLFESQRVRNHVDVLALFAQRPDLGKNGAQFAELAAQLKSLWSEVEQNGADHSEQLTQVIKDLEKTISGIPSWIGARKEIEIRYNQVASQFRENTLAKNVDYSNLFRAVEKLTVNSPQSIPVANKAASILDRLIAANLYAKAIEFGDLIGKSYANANDASVLAIRDRWVNQMALCKHGIEQKIHDWSKNPNLVTDDALNDVRTGIQGLKADNQLSEFTLDRIAVLLRTVETGSNQEAFTKTVALLKGELGADSGGSERIAQLCQAAEKRLSIIGKKFPLPEAEAEKGQVSETDIAGQWVVVSFWQANDPKSVDTLVQLEKFGNSPIFENSKPSRLAINVDDDLAPAKALLANITYDWPVLVPKSLANGRNPYAVQYGIEMTPYYLVVNPEGVVEFAAMHSTDIVSRRMAKQPDSDSDSD